MIENVQKMLTLHGLAIIVLARAYVFRMFYVLVMFSYVFRTNSVHFLWAGGWSGLGPGVSKKNKECPKKIRPKRCPKKIRSVQKNKECPTKIRGVQKK